MQAEVAVVRLCGDFDVADRPRLIEALSGAGRARTLIVDLTRTGYVDLTLINCLIAVQKTRGSGNPDGKIILRGASAHVRRLLGITNLETLFAVEDGCTPDGVELDGAHEIVILSQ